MFPQKFKTIKIGIKESIRDNQRLFTWPGSEGKDPGYENICFRVETKSTEHFIIMEKSFFGEDCMFWPM